MMSMGYHEAIWYSDGNQRKVMLRYGEIEAVGEHRNL